MKCLNNWVLRQRDQVLKALKTKPRPETEQGFFVQVFDRIEGLKNYSPSGDEFTGFVVPEYPSPRSLFFLEQPPEIPSTETTAPSYTASNFKNLREHGNSG